MSILWAGGEDIDFPNGSAVSASTASTWFRTGYARCNVFATTGQTYARSNNFIGGPITSCWLTTRFGFMSVTSSLLFGLCKDQTNNSGLYIGIDSVTTAKAAIFKFDGTTKTELASESGTSLSSVLHRFDVQLINYGTSATVNVYLDSVFLFTFTGDVTVSGVTSLGAFVAGNSSQGLSEIIVADEDTRSMSVVTMAPNATGTTDSWTGTIPGNINPITINDANFVYTNLLTQDEQANLIDMPSGNFIVKAVKASVRAGITAGSTATKVAIGINQAGTIDPGTPQSPPLAYFGTFERLMQTNPVTTNNWLLSEMNPLQMNLRSS